MVRHYRQDISPNSDDAEPVERPVRSIRDFKPSASRMRLQTPPQRESQVRVEERRSRFPVWILAGLSILVLLGVAILVFFPSTTVNVIPRTHVMTFDATSPFTAYPQNGTATGTIPYTVTIKDFEDSAVVQASGTEHAEEKATGKITIVNETNHVVRLIKNTRFQTPEGRVYRIPESVEVAAAGQKPGTASVAVFADQIGPEYNSGPIAKLTLPGLKSSPDYTKVYASSDVGFSGGFSGDRPAISPPVLESARADLRTRLQEQARAFTTSAGQDAIAFAELAAITFETQPPEKEPTGGVRIKEKAHLVLPIFSKTEFGGSLARAVSADSEGQTVSVRFGTVTVAPDKNLNPLDIGSKPITFAVTGKGQLVWAIDGSGLASALAGKAESAFETIVRGFPSIEEAHARLSPFWRNSFPQDPAHITIVVEQPPQF